MFEYIVNETCPHCESDISMTWSVKHNGYAAYCPYCGKKMMLCNECFHANDNKIGFCNWEDKCICCWRDRK